MIFRMIKQINGDKTMSNFVQTKSKRLIHLDLLRLLAIFLVIFNHTGERGYTLFISKMNSPISLLYMSVSVFCKIAVPLFFMISGALLLKKEESLKQLFLKRIFRIAIVIVLISVPYYYWLHRSNGIEIGSFFKWIYSNSASTSLWYLYSYLALLLMLPFLRSMVKNMQQKDFLYLICGYFVFVGVLPCAEYLLFHEVGVLHGSLSPMLFVTQNMFFALVGYYLEHVFNTNTHNRKALIFSITFSIVAILITCFMTYYQASLEGINDVEIMERFFNSFICVPTIMIYFLIKYLGTKINNETIGKTLSVLGSAVFGVYLIEKIMRAALDIVYQATLPLLGSFVASLVWCSAVLVSCLIIVIALKHTPWVKKIVNRFI